jgi:hypothetical protein
MGPIKYLCYSVVFICCGMNPAAEAEVQCDYKLTRPQLEYGRLQDRVQMPEEGQDTRHGRGT